MTQSNVADRPRFRVFGPRDLDSIPQLAGLAPSERRAMKVVSRVLPFQVNPYVLEQLIDWRSVPDDPIFQLTFPQRGMLEPGDFARIERLLARKAPDDAVAAAVAQVQRRLNPHPAGQQALNVPMEDGARLPGIQHKYRETVLFFPAQGQTCHAYCTYCFRWPQFVGLEDMRFASREAADLVGYVRAHEEVTSVLFTGGDPLVMRTAVLRRYVEPLLDRSIEHLATIRLGTKSMAYWPHRFLTDPDADDLLRLFEQVVASGRSLAFMAHYSHPRELSTPVAREALRRILSTGAVVRCQAPLVAHVNDDAQTWADLWRMEVQLGAIPYYMFVARDTGARRYFEVPLARAFEIYRAAFSRVSGLARTVRGPSMSATPGKVVIDGVANVRGEDVFALRLLQARDARWVGRPFFAKLDTKASWFDDLVPAFDEKSFFFTEDLDALHGRDPRAWPRKPATRSLPLLPDDDELAA